jgi:glycosyltransferase involved in cell wall biosynthesis
MTARIASALAPPAAYDVLHVEHLRAALYGLGAPLRPRVYDAVDCMSSLLARTAAAGPTWASRATARAEIARTRRFERAALERFDRVLLTSESERRALLALASGNASDRVQAVPNGVDLDHFAPRAVARDPATLIFVGRMGYHANLAGAQRLVRDIMPRVWAQRPEARLLLVGTEPPAALRALAARAGERVSVTGTVPDVRPYLARATVSVNPLPYAVGIQNKVLEAMAMATPVVASPLACTALGAAPGVDLLVEAEADPFAAAVLRLLADPSVAERIGAAGRRYVTAHHDWRQAIVRLETIYRDAIDAVAGAAPAPPAREVVA